MDKYAKQLAAVEREMRDSLAKARAITTAAGEAGRSITEDEEVELKSFLADVEVLKDKRDEVLGAIATRQRVEDAGKAIVVEEDERRPATPAHRKAESIGEAFVKSEGYKRLRETGFNGDWSTGAIEIEGKTLLSEAGGSGANLVGSNAPDIAPGILPTLFQGLTVASLMAQGSTSASLVRYMIESSVTNAAAGTAEGATKPESTLVFSSTDEPVKKIATFLPVTEEMLEDVAQMASYINSRLALFVQLEEERQILKGAGGNELVGLYTRIAANNKGLRSTAASANDADHVFRAISRVRESFLEPDYILMHPNDWEGIMALKATTAQYISGFAQGPFGPIPAGSETTGQGVLWGKPVLVSQSVTEAQPIVGAFRQAAQVFRKGGLSVEASNSHSTFFQENKVAIRAEERLALAVYRPTAFAVADLGASGAGT